MQTNPMSSSRGRTVALVPLRGGSKGIPRKNLKAMGGKPLCAWVIGALLASDAVDEVWVSTEDAEIAHVARECGAHVHSRDPAAATDKASTVSVILDFKRGQPRVWDGMATLVLAQATSPLTSADDVSALLAKMDSSDLQSILTVTRQHCFTWEEDADGSARPTNFNPWERPRRQEWGGVLIENGALYAIRRDAFEECNSLVSRGRHGVLEMDPSTGYEIDAESDWTIVEALLLQRGAGEPCGSCSSSS